MADDTPGFTTVNIDANVHASAVAESGRTGVPVRLVILRWILLGQHAEADLQARIADGELQRQQLEFGPSIAIDYGVPDPWLQEHFEVGPALHCRRCGAMFRPGPDDWQGRHEPYCPTGDVPIPAPVDKSVTHHQTIPADLSQTTAGHRWLDEHFLLGSHAGDIGCRVCRVRFELNPHSGDWEGTHIGHESPPVPSP